MQSMDLKYQYAFAESEEKPGSEVIKTISRPTQLSMKILLAQKW